MQKKVKPAKKSLFKPTLNASLGDESCSDESAVNTTSLPRRSLRSGDDVEPITADKENTPINFPLTRRSNTRNTTLANERSAHQSPRTATSNQKTSNQSDKTKTIQLKGAAKRKNTKHANLNLESYPGFLIPRLPFARFVREIMYQATNNGSIHSITPVALEALQTAAEMHLTQILQDAYYLCLHRGRVTLSAKDIVLIKYLTFN